jgi:predicted pyridoxine 5'-phosphate oxidase superfamily flavin-nucleotide-binding protein
MAAKRSIFDYFILHNNLLFAPLIVSVAASAQIEPMSSLPIVTSPSDVAFSPAVKEVQQRKGSRELYARRGQGADWAVAIDDDLAAFIAAQNSFFLATASASGQPYVQHRGGPPGFLRVLDEHTLGFADFRGNRQYISLGNLAENPKVQLFLLDYARRARVKIWGQARVVEDDPALLARLQPEGYAARPEQAILIRVSAWDRNCRQHLPQKFEAADVAAALAQRDAEIARRDLDIVERDAKIAELEAELRRLSPAI